MTLFDGALPPEPAPPEAAPFSRGQVDYLAGMLGAWCVPGKTSEAQRARLEEIARDTLERARHVNPGGTA